MLMWLRRRVMAYGGPNERQWTFVRIDTDEGIHGWGEATNYPGGGSFLTARAILAMKEVLIGEDPTNIEPLWHRLFRRYTYMSSRGFASTAISGIDIALWDIKGKALGVPVYELLGGKFRDEVRLYANGWFPNCSTPEDYYEAAKKVVAAGHEAMKLDPFLEMVPVHTRFTDGVISHEGEQLGYDIVRAVREAIGPKPEILIDAHGNFNVPTAIRLANTLHEQSNIEWFEEPLPQESFDALATVRQNTVPNICVGERALHAVGFHSGVPAEPGQLHHAGHCVDWWDQRDQEDRIDGGGVLHSDKSAQRDGFDTDSCGGACLHVDGEFLPFGTCDFVYSDVPGDAGGADRV